MPKFGKSSLERLSTCVPELQDIFNEVVSRTDCSILCGSRTKEKQDEAFLSGKSKVQWPNSKHNVVGPQTKSRAVDVAPYPIDWDDLNRFYLFAGIVKGIAQSKGYKIRFGGDWDDDMNLKDQNFNDLPHFEYIGRL